MCFTGVFEHLSFFVMLFLASVFVSILLRFGGHFDSIFDSFGYKIDDKSWLIFS